MTLEATPKGVLHGMYELLRIPERWTQHDSGRAADGHGTSAADPKAIAWCLMGAMSLQLNDLFGEDIIRRQETSEKVRDKLYEAMGHKGETLTDFNDTHTHAEVLDVISRAHDLAHAPA